MSDKRKSIPTPDGEITLFQGRDNKWHINVWNETIRNGMVDFTENTLTKEVVYKLLYHLRTINFEGIEDDS